MIDGNVVVVGGGVAAQRCAFELRRRGHRGPVTLLCAEDRPPYDRTLLSKDNLTGSADPVPLAPAQRYAEHGIEVRLSTAASWLDTRARTVGLSDGGTATFDALVLCVGGQPVLPSGLDAPGVVVVREAAGTDRLRAVLDRGGQLVVIGGGFVGGEVASAAVRRGLDVTIVEQAGAPLEPVLGAEIGERVAGLHRMHGVKVLTGTGARAVTAGESGYRVDLVDGSVLSADAVVVGVGMAPATGWLADSGLHLDRGIVTDARCRASAGVFAAGDCARWWHPTYQRYCQVEHWDTANRHGAAAAAAALGADEPFAPMPFFWSDQHGVKFQWAGHAPDWDDVRISEETADGGLVARYHLDGELVGVLAAGSPRAFAKARRELTNSTGRC